MSWAVGVSLCLLLPSLMIFPAARSLCDFPVFRALPLVSAESWEHGPIQLLWCDVPLPGFHLLPWKIPFLAGAKFPLLYFTFSFLLLLFLFIFFPLVAFSLRCRFVVFCFGCTWSRYLKLSIAWVATCRLGNAPARKRRVSFCSCLCCCCPGLQIHTAKYTQTHRHKHFSWNCRPFSLFGFNYMKMKSDFQYPSYNSVLYSVWLLYRHYSAEIMRQFVGCSSSGCLAVSLMNSVFSS